MDKLLPSLESLGRALQLRRTFTTDGSIVRLPQVVHVVGPGGGASGRFSSFPVGVSASFTPIEVKTA